MNSELLHQALDIMERAVRSQPSPSEFELAYQARVAIDRIRFAIKHAEQFGKHSQQMSEANLQCSMHWTGWNGRSADFNGAFAGPPQMATKSSSS
jgi:hypothetical protein